MIAAIVLNSSVTAALSVLDDDAFDHVGDVLAAVRDDLQHVVELFPFQNDDGVALAVEQPLHRLLVDAIQKAQKGERTLMMLDAAQASALTGPPAVDGIGPTGRWEEYYRETDAARRSRAPWAAKAA